MSESLLADLILLVHFAIALFIALGLALIPIGAIIGWRWIRRRRLRQLHVAAISFVALESLLGIACPLTVWEDKLRGMAPAQGGFIERWVGRLLYYDLPPSFFLALYVAAALFAWLLWRRVPPARP